MSEDDVFAWDNEPIFKDEHVFEIDYMPEEFLHRESQIETIKYALKPAVRGARPLNVMAQGPPGTGKTTTIQILFDELQAQTDIEAVRVNCQHNSTQFKVLSNIYEDIRGHQTPPQGIQLKELFTKISDYIQNEVLLVALDDINYLFYESEASDTLYSLLRAHEEREGIKIGVLVISSDLDLNILEELDGRVQSVFRPEEIYFPVYDEVEIVEILKERARRGFHDHVIELPVLDKVASLTAEQGGDIRVGIDLLRRAGLKAEIRGSRTVEKQDVEKAYENSKYVHLSRRLQGLSESETALVEIIAEHDSEQAGDIYEQVHEQTDIGYTRYTDIINKLDQLDIIDANYTEVDEQGRSRQLSLNYDADAVLERL